MGNLFELQAILKSAPNDLELYKVKVAVYIFDKCSWVPVSRYKVVDDQKYNEWPQNDIEHLTIKGT